MIERVGRAGLAAAVVAVIYLGFGLATAGDPQHRVHLELAEDRTTWPWHSSIQRAAAAWINSPEGRVEDGETTVRAEVPETIVDLYVVSTAPTAPEASAAADETVAGFLQHDLALQAEPFELDVRVLQEITTELRAEFDEQARLDSAAGSADESALRSAHLEGTARLLGRYESELQEVETELAQLQPRYIVRDSAPLTPLNERLPETIKLFGGILMLGWIGQTFQTRPDAG